MALLVNSPRNISNAGTATVNVLTASDTVNYVANTGQLLEFDNTTGGSLTVVLKGSSPNNSFPIHGFVLDFTTGLSIVVPAGVKKFLDMDKTPKFFDGTGVVTLTGAAGLKVTCFTNQ